MTHSPTSPLRLVSVLNLRPPRRSDPSHNRHHSFIGAIDADRNRERSLRFSQACSLVQGSGQACPSTRSTRRLQLHEISLLLGSYPVSSLRYSTISTAFTAFKRVPRWLLSLWDRLSCCLHFARRASDLEA